MVKNIKRKSFNKTVREYFESFKQDKRFLRTISLDLSFFLLLGLGIIPLWTMIMTKLSESIEGMDLIALQNSMNEELASETLVLIQGFIIKTLLAAFLILIVVFLLYTLIKSLIWKILIKKKFTKKYYYQSLVLNLVWSILFIVVFVLTLVPSLNAIQGLTIIRIFSLLLLSILIYLRTITFIKLAEKNNLKLAFKEIKNGFNQKYKKPTTFIIVTFILVSLLSQIIVYLPSAIYLVLAPIIILLFSAWARVCIINNLKK